MISVVIPSHNNAALLAKTLAGFAAQEPIAESWEVIVVDNNSSDESIAAVHREMRNRMALTLIQQPQLPHPFALCRARNIGIKIAKGEWIACIDADTIPNGRYLKTLTNFLQRQGENPVICTGERMFVAADTITPQQIMNNPRLLDTLPPITSPSNYGLSVDRRLPTMKRLPDVGHAWDYIHGCSAVYRKSDALAIGGYHEAYDGHWGYEDIDFAYRMITRQDCTPLYIEGLHIYHQDLPETDFDPAHRYDKTLNPNWARICDTIPGYREYKIAKYRQLNNSIKI
jgi:glycosyltransferase involved in cell wall biosynthesis